MLSPHTKACNRAEEEEEEEEHQEEEENKQYFMDQISTSET